MVATLVGVWARSDSLRLALLVDLPAGDRRRRRDGTAHDGHRFSLQNPLLVNLLHSGVTSWARLQPGVWEWTVGLLSTVACLCALVQREGRRISRAETLRRVGIAAAMLLLSVLPLLAARENNAAYRSLPVLYLVVAFLGVDGLTRLTRARPAWIRVGTPLVLVAASAGAARYHVWHGLVSPNLREYVGLRDQVRAQFPAGSPGRLVYLLPPPTLLAAGWLTPSWEYGLVSSSFWWVTRPSCCCSSRRPRPSAGHRRS